jgi:hypothetical protein
MLAKNLVERKRARVKYAVLGVQGVRESPLWLMCMQAGVLERLQQAAGRAHSRVAVLVAAAVLRAVQRRPRGVGGAAVVHAGTGQ